MPGSPTEVGRPGTTTEISAAEMIWAFFAAHGWVDAIVDPVDTRETLIQALEIATRHVDPEPYRLGVFQV